MSGLVKGVETWLVPVKLQQLYKGYSLSEVTLADIVMPHTFLASLARLADVIYKTGTVRSHSTPGSKQDKDLQAALRSQSGNYGFLRRFDAATGMAFETKGPFGAVVATCVLPGQDNDVPLTGHVHPFQPRYRIYVVFRGTSPGKLYWDDISTDLKAASLNLDNPLGSKSGTLARGFLNTYMSCRHDVAKFVNEAATYLQAEFRRYAEGCSPAASAPARLASRASSRLTRSSSTWLATAWEVPWPRSARMTWPSRPSGSSGPCSSRSAARRSAISTSPSISRRWW